MNVETPFLNKLPRKHWDEPLWQLDPRFHTPGWAEKRLKQLEEERIVLDRIRAIVREELRAAKGKSNEPATSLDGEWKGNLQSWHHGMSYRGYSLTELDTMIDFYRMQKGDIHGR